MKHLKYDYHVQEISTGGLDVSRITLIDGCFSASDSLMKALRAYGYKVTRISMEELNPNNVSGYLCELFLVYVDSMDALVAQYIESIRTKSAVPIIVVTRGKSNNGVSTALAAGANDYLDGLYSIEVLKARIRVQLR